jgi:hypothetical protein
MNDVAMEAIALLKCWDNSPKSGGTSETPWKMFILGLKLSKSMKTTEWETI